MAGRLPTGEGRSVRAGEASHTRWAAPVALALAALYLLTRSRIHTWDSIAYAARAAGDPLLADAYFSSRLFHPHHLFYSPLAVVTHRLLAPLGLAPDPFLPLQALNAVLGALSAWLAGRLALRLGADPRRALWVTLAVGVSNAVWRFSTEVLVMVPSLTFLLLAAWLGAGARTRGAWLAAGVALSGAMLIHQSALVFAAAASLALGIAGGRRAGRGAALAFTLGWSVPAGAAYLVVGALETGSLSPRALAGWMTAAGHRSTSLHAPPLAVLRSALAGLAEAWVTLTPLRALRAGAEPGAWAGAAGALAGLAAAAIALRSALPRLARAVRAGEPGFSMPMAGALATAGLVVAFQPWNHAYWVYFPPLACALVAAALPPLPGLARRALPLVLAVVAAVNLLGRALPATDPARAPYADLLAQARLHLRPGDRLVCGGAESAIGEGVIALPFFARVPVILAPRPGRPDDERRFVRLVDEALAGTVSSGSSLFVTADARAPLARTHPGLAPRAVGSLRGMTLYRLEPGS